MPPQVPTLSARGWQTVVWCVAASLQYGWHITALNQIQDALTCSSPHKSSVSSSFLPPCIPMDKFVFAVVTSSFTVGGLIGSIAANRSMNVLGRKSSIRINALFILIGSALMTVSASVPPLVIGRFLIGIGSGLGLCVVPPYLSEISSPSIKGSVGVLNQLGIVTGILVTQALGIVLAAPTRWRFIPLIAAAIALAQLLLSFLAIDSPAWLSSNGRLPEAKAASALLWGDPTLVPTTRRTSEDALREEESLLSHPPRDDDSQAHARTHDLPTLKELLKAPLRRPLLIVSLGMIAQQISGINAVLYYSNAILGRVIPDAAAYVSLGVTVVNALMTFPPIYLIERIGRRSLITLSTFGALLSLLGIGYGIDAGYVVLASIAILTFVASFAIGLGPVPFVIIPDVSPFHAVGTLSSIALSLNWITNFIVGIAFFPVRDLLAHGNVHHEGRVFYVFAVVLFVVYVAWARVYTGT